MATGGLKQLTGTAGQVAMYSGCAWAGAWVQSHDAGDTAGQQAAIAGLERTANSSDLAYIDGGGLVARAEALVIAATAGEAAPIAA